MSSSKTLQIINPVAGLTTSQAISDLNGYNSLSFNAKYDHPTLATANLTLYYSNDNITFQLLKVVELSNGISKLGSLSIVGRYFKFTLENTDAADMTLSQVYFYAHEQVYSCSTGGDDAALQQEIQDRINADIVLQNQINLSATQISLNTEIQDRTFGDATLQNQLDLKSDTTALNTEIQNRTNEDATIKSKTLYSNSYYVNSGVNTLQSQIDLVGTSQGNAIYMTAGGTSENVVINDANLLTILAPSTQLTTTQLAGSITLTGTTKRININNLQITGGLTDNAQGNNKYYRCNFSGGDITLGGNTLYTIFESCEFNNTGTLTISAGYASACYFINCNFNGMTMSLLQSQSVQVIFNNCAGFTSFNANATYAGLNSLTSGILQNSVAKTVLAVGGSGTSGQVLTSGGSGGVDTWTTPSGGGSGSGVCLESINEVLRGQSITTKNGDLIVLPNITSVVQPNQTGGYSILAAINGYIPPTGTKSVMLSLKFFIGWSGVNGSCNALFNCRIDGGGPTTIVKTSDSFIKSDRGMGEIGAYSIDCLINIDSSYTDSIPEGKFSSWTTGKLFNFCCSRTITNGIPYIFSNNPHPYNTALLKFVEPIIIIQAFS